MSTTIFCTFEQQDMADMAVGKIRDSVTGLKSIHYVNGHNSKSIYPNTEAATNSAMNLVGTMTTDFGVTPSRPVRVKIVCSDVTAAQIKSKLVNMRAYEIVATR